MNGLDKKNNTAVNSFEFKEGEQILLSSNESSVCSPSLDFLDTSAENVSEDMILQYLACIISAIYLKTLCSSKKLPKQ